MLFVCQGFRVVFSQVNCKGFFFILQVYRVYQFSRSELLLSGICLMIVLLEKCAEMGYTELSTKLWINKEK